MHEWVHSWLKPHTPKAYPHIFLHEWPKPQPHPFVHSWLKPYTPKAYPHIFLNGWPQPQPHPFVHSWLKPHTPKAYPHIFLHEWLQPQPQEKRSGVGVSPLKNEKSGQNIKFNHRQCLYVSPGLKGGARRQPHGQRGRDLWAGSIHSGKGSRTAGTPHQSCPIIIH